MKSESDTNAADEDETKWSFLRRLIVAMAAERLKKADEVVKPRPPRVGTILTKASLRTCGQRGCS